MTHMRAPICVVKNVTANYVAGPGPVVQAVDDVSLTIHHGEVLGIAGESGCGKSTLAAIMSMTARPPLIVRDGEMIVEGEKIELKYQTRAPVEWHGQVVSLLPQRSLNSLNPTAKVSDFVVDVVRGHDATISPKQAIDLARERLDIVSLPPRVLDSYPHQLSGGMRQRVVAVISTLLNPTVLIADEPTSALDVSSQKQLVMLLQLLLEREFIRCIAFITHDLPMLSNIAHRIAVMYAGNIVEIGATEQIVESPEHPYTKALITSTLDPDPRVRGRQLSGLPGAPPDLRYPPLGCRFHPRCPFVMDVCKAGPVPAVGDENHFAVCHWVAQQAQPMRFHEVDQ